ncbi:MAG: hypothetical protein AB7V55_00945 [Oscillospiraceae bacterium]
MGKRVLAWVAAAACLLLVGCANPAGDNFANQVTDWRPESRRDAYGEPSDIVPYDAPGFEAELGFIVTDYPDDDALTPIKNFAIDSWFAQIEYETADERVLVVRIAREDAGGKRLVDTYHEGHYSNPQELDVDGVEVRVRMAERGCTLVSWVKGGFQYLMHSNNLQSPPTTEEITALVAGLSTVEATDASASNPGA